MATAACSRKATQAGGARLVVVAYVLPAPTLLYTHGFPLEDLATALDMTRDRPEGFMKAIILP